MTKLLWIALAGGLGALARFGLVKLVQDAASTAKGDFPWGTLAVNILGCLIFGLVWTMTTERFTISPELRVAVLIGFLGAFTTFSTFAFETSGFLRDGQWLLAAGNLTAQNVLGLLAMFAGLTLGKWI